MTLSISEIYSIYSVRDFIRYVEIKRRNTDGTYESDYQDVETLSGLKLFDNSVNSISYSLANDNYNFGIVNVGNCSIVLNSKNGQFDNENNIRSVFSGYYRHRSLIRVREGYVDPLSGDEVLITTFEGFIDDTATGTKVDDENLKQTLQCVDLLSFLLKDYTVSDMDTISSVLLSDLIYEILNREEFTDFFTVSTSNINPGYDILNFDITQYENQTQLFTLFENFSVGHSFFYVKDGIFYYKQVDEGTASTLTIDSKKIIKFSGYTTGTERVFEKIYWSNDDSISYISTTNLYNKSKTISVDGITNSTDKQLLVNKVGSLTRLQKDGFSVQIPFYPDIFILDEVSISAPEIIPDDAMVWGITKWDSEKVWRDAISANNIANNISWRIVKVSHSNLVTTLVCEEIV